MNQRQIVLPGECVAKGAVRIPHTFIEDNNTYAAAIGFLDAEGKYVPLESPYRPFEGDMVLGIITEIKGTAGYILEMNHPSHAFIPARTMRTRLSIGDIVLAQVERVDEVGNVDAMNARRLPVGHLLEFPPAKIPRLIGRKSSMLALIQEHAGGEIIVGNNGLIWVSENSNISLVRNACELVIKNAHFSGLTDKMGAFLSEQIKHIKKVDTL